MSPTERHRVTESSPDTWSQSGLQFFRERSLHELHQAARALLELPDHTEGERMPIDFTLTEKQQELREGARDFAQNILAPLVKEADASSDPHESFAKTKPAYIDKMGHRLCSNASLVFEDVHVPEENVISGTKGNGDLVISKAFTWSGPVAAIAAVGVARAAYEYTLGWAKEHTGGGSQPIIQHRHVAYLLSDIAMKIESARY
jgi:alkylation response protein AidB-like acyl-CoA dehydrogenase